MRRARHIKNAIVRLGLPCGLKYYFADRVMTALGRGNNLYKIHPPQAEHPLYLRPGTSDRDVFRQTFIEEEYGIIPKNNNHKVQTVVDCGANIGITTVYLAKIFPKAQLIAIEPDPGNFSVLRKIRVRFVNEFAVLTLGCGHIRLVLKLSVEITETAESGLRAFEPLRMERKLICRQRRLQM